MEKLQLLKTPKERQCRLDEIPVVHDDPKMDPSYDSDDESDTGSRRQAFLCISLFLKVKGTWCWMLGVAAVPALVQFVLMLSLPESPRWLYRKDKVSQAEAILSRIYSTEQVEEEMNALKQSVENEIAEEGEIGERDIFTKVRKALGNKIFRRGLYAGITVQVAQQFVGINTVMYYIPTIVQLAGFASNKTALALSLITSGLNVVRSIVSMAFVDRYGRRRLMIISMIGIITCLIVLLLCSNKLLFSMISLLIS